MSDKAWEMPPELSPYRKLIEAGCGGNTAESLMNRKGVNYFNNPILCEMIGMCNTKLIMLLKMHKLNLLPKMESADLEGIIARGLN